MESTIRLIEEIGLEQLLTNIKIIEEKIKYDNLKKEAVFVFDKKFGELNKVEHDGGIFYKDGEDEVVVYYNTNSKKCWLNHYNNTLTNLKHKFPLEKSDVQKLLSSSVNILFNIDIKLLN